MPIPSHLIVDLDDTIVDYSAPGAETWAALFPRFARTAGVSADRLREAVLECSNRYWSDPGRHREGRLSQIQARRTYVRDAFRLLGMDSSPVADEMADAFSREREERVRLFPGALEALQEMRASGARMAMLTNGESALQRRKIERFSLAPLFDAILIEQETGCGKPAERAYRAALEAVGSPPEDACWMVGDDPKFDIVPARRLGLHAAWIRGDEDPDAQPGADLTVDSLAGLVRIWTAGEAGRP
jgi:putative hydrolase of the HAD superfamily